MNHYDSSILLCIRITNLTTPVGGSIIHNNQLKITIGLVQDTLYRALHIQMCIIDWHDNAYHWRMTHKSSPVLQPHDL